MNENCFFHLIIFKPSYLPGVALKVTPSKALFFLGKKFKLKFSFKYLF